MRTLLLLPVLVAVCGTLIDSPRGLPLAFAKPQNTIASYWHRMIERRHAEALQCFTEAVPQDIDTMLALPNLVELRCVDFRISNRTCGRADVRYTIEYRVSLTDSLARFDTGDRVQLTHRGWKIERPLLLVAKSE